MLSLNQWGIMGISMLKEIESIMTASNTEDLKKAIIKNIRKL